MNLQFLGASALGAAMIANAPLAPAITSFDDLSAHIPEPRREQYTHHQTRFQHENQADEYTAAELNGHILFRGVNLDEEVSTELNVLDAAELNCLAENIYFESRGETLAGQMAVGMVTMNRVNSGEYADTVCEVVHQGSLNGNPPSRDSCQFSWYCDGLPENINDEVAWQRSVAVASRILENQVRDFTDGATHFHATYMQPDWARNLIKTVTIDNLSFYREV